MTTIDDSFDTELLERVLGEYCEMPGLTLTMDQARRLWGCDAAICQRVIEILVARCVLRWSRDGFLIRGCCPGEHSGSLIQRLLSHGHVISPGGHSVRMVAFGDLPENDLPKTWTTVSMRHVVQFLQQYLREHWDVLRHAQIRDPAFGVLALIEKWGAASPPRAEQTAPPRRRPHGSMRMRRRP